ncbi:MAG: hypothetical protein Q7R68_00375 [Nitrospirales bacterium]|nr:hypothetical protein [Nitrospirales bacterium]
MDLGLRQRLAAGELDQPASVLIDFAQDVVEAALGSPVKGIGSVATGSAQRASRHPDEDTGPARMGGFPLDAEEDFGDAHGRLARIIHDGS